MATTNTEDISMSSPPPESSDQGPPSPKYGGFTRFEIELEFVQSLASPPYLLHLATSSSSTTGSEVPTPLLQHPPFVEYLKYLQYWKQPEYARYLMYVGPTLKNLELLQSERFRRDVLNPEIVETLARAGVMAVERFFAGEEK